MLNTGVSTVIHTSLEAVGTASEQTRTPVGSLYDVPYLMSSLAKGKPV